ncbi:hypothetical protein QYM36_012512 [Artemia franciscana]|uniref:DUF4371 domain-containing protein n=1 Tax=Artemia franciscana TaxID=6661 RepID=A0AA88HV10_ARTSF|nr:hypothetical protein QYM36_012509 [Artemia franciscana]KAK2711350.1 hypothetical protein QYM36_012512 [Artemia franciscana]
MDGSQMPLNPLFESTLYKRLAASLCEMRLVIWFAAEDVPFKKADSLTLVLKVSVSDSSILCQVKLKRTKVKGVIHDLMTPLECQTLAELLTRAHYSLIVDEITDKSSAKAFVMIAKYKHRATLLVKKELLGLLEVTDASSEGQKKLIRTYLKDIGVAVSNLIGIVYDNASVSNGVHGGLGALFQESLLHLFMLGCTGHSPTLCASYASKFLPDKLKLFLKEFINYVAGSPKIIAELNQIQEFFQSTHYKLLQITNT